MLEQLKSIVKEFGVEAVYKICMDAIYVDPKIVDKVKLMKNFRVKRKEKIENSEYESKYIIPPPIFRFERDETKETPDYEVYPSYKGSNKQYILYKGEGGSGKTTTAFENFINPFYITDSCDLLEDKSITTKYHKNSVVLASFIRKDILTYNLNIRYHPANIILDESTKYISKLGIIKKMFPNSRIIFIADVDKDGHSYQLAETAVRSHTGTGKTKKRKELIFPLEMIEEVVEFKTDYRSNCEKLRELKRLLRTEYRDNPEELVERFQTIDYSELNNKYKINDYVLTPLRKNIKKFTDSLWNIGEKYRVMKNKDNYLNGQVLYTKPDLSPSYYEKRHAFTVHSLQGRTITNNIYIDLNGMFDKKQIYVAVSRAKSYDQIYFINKNNTNKQKKSILSLIPKKVKVHKRRGGRSQMRLKKRN
jgi:hypothetical protein